jgi:hypothetical protein
MTCDRCHKSYDKPTNIDGLCESCTNKEAVKHTPGPWKAELANKGRKNACEFWAVIEDNHSRTHRDSIVNMFWSDGIRPDDEANARLIAAAPELLEALELLHSISKHQRAVFGSEEAVASAYATARAAIAKAKGGAL